MDDNLNVTANQKLVIKQLYVNGRKVMRLKTGKRDCVTLLIAARSSWFLRVLTLE